MSLLSLTGTSCYVIASLDLRVTYWIARLSTLGSDGKWPDSEINYTTGCPAQTGSWPAQEHWERIGMATA